MALVVKDRVRETSTSTGTGTIILNGAVAGFQSFAAVGDGNTTYYTIVDAVTEEWEVGIGTYTASGTTLSRDTVLESSNGGTAINFAANIKDVFVTYPAERSVYVESGVITPASGALLPVVSGGTGAATLTGYVKGAGTSALTASPTIPSTDITGLGTMSVQNANNVAITGGSINGTTIGASTASTGAFTNLSYTGTLTGSTGVINIGSGQLYKDASGNVGIGTSSPLNKLDVFGKSRIYLNNTSIGNASSLQLTQDGSGDAAISFLIGATTEWLAGVDNSDSDSFKISNITGGGDFTNTGVTLTTAGNVGIGTSSPGANLEVYGNPISRIRSYDGTTQTDLLSFAGSGYVGTTSSHPMLFTTAGIERMRITDAGNVGIGTSSPQEKLDVNGNIRAGTTVSGQFIGVYNGTADATRIRLQMSGTDGVIQATRNSGAVPNILFYIDATERMRITSSGNVGIGTSSPNYRFETLFDAAVTAGGCTALLSAEGGVQGSVGTTTNHALLLKTNNIEKVRITPDGNVGIGTSSPASRLEVLQSQNGATRVRVNNQNSGASAVAGIDLQAFGGGWAIDVPASTSFVNPLTFAFNNTERMRITSAGNVGIGTSSPAVRLHAATTDNVTVARFTGASYAVRVQSITGVGALLEGTNNTEGTYQPLLVGGSVLQLTINGSERARIDSSGNLLVGTTSAISGGAKLQTANGITFPATQVPSANANTLDDYEEGTFTTTISSGASGITYLYQSGSYIKIGQFVWFSMDIQATSATADGGQLKFGGLPFVAAASPTHAFGSAMTSYGNTINRSAFSSLNMHITFGSTSVDFYDGAAPVAGNNAGVLITGRLIITGVYRAAS